MARNSKKIKLDIKTPHIGCSHNTNFCRAAALTEEDVTGNWPQYVILKCLRLYSISTG